MAIHNPLDMEHGHRLLPPADRRRVHRALGGQHAGHAEGRRPRRTRRPRTSPTRGRATRSGTASTRACAATSTCSRSSIPTSVPANTPGRQIDQPVTWCDVYEGGRTWITSMGHAKSVYSEELFRKHVLGGAEWAAGVAPGDCKAGDWDNYDKVALDTNTSAPWGIAVAPDKRVFFTELVRGQVRVYDPAQERTVTAATIPVYSGGEDGLLGLALDPGFATNNWVYVYYSPEGDARDQPPVALHDGRQHDGPRDREGHARGPGQPRQQGDRPYRRYVALRRPGQPLPVGRRRRQPVRVLRLRADRRAARPRALRRAGHLGQHQRPARQAAADQARARRHVLDPAGQPVRAR